MTLPWLERIHNAPCPDCGKITRNMPLHRYHAHTKEGKEHNLRTIRLAQDAVRGMTYERKPCDICGDLVGNIGAHKFLAHGGQDPQVRVRNGKMKRGTIWSEEQREKFISNPKIQELFDSPEWNNRIGFKDPETRNKAFSSIRNHRSGIPCEGHVHYSVSEKKACDIIRKYEPNPIVHFTWKGREIDFVVNEHAIEWHPDGYSSRFLEYRESRQRLLQELEFPYPVFITMSKVELESFLSNLYGIGKSIEKPNKLESVTVGAG